VKVNQRGHPLTFHPGSRFILDQGHENMTMRIGTLADAAGVNIPTVRYYERRGIIAEPPRTASGYRQYDEGVVDRIRFIRRVQDLGFTLEEIEDLLALRVNDPASCGAVADASRAKLATVESKIRELDRLRAILSGLVRACEERETTEECPDNGPWHNGPGRQG
jgi:MerR family transcriptional regulator, copper efflux regulator